MHRKICTIGNSQGVSLPSEVLERLHLSVGSEVEVTLDTDQARIVIEPIRRGRLPKGLDKEFVSQVNDFIEKYRPALDELAGK